MSPACKQFLEDLGGDLGSTPSLEFDRHCTVCPPCRILWDTLQWTVRYCKTCEPCALPPDVHARLQKALERRMAMRRRLEMRRGGIS